MNKKLILLALVFILLVPNAFAWYNNTFDKHKNITYSPTNHTSQPILIDVDDICEGNCESDFCDIRILNNSGVEVPFEILDLNGDNTPDFVQFIYHDTSTTYQVYYDGGSGVSCTNETIFWDFAEFSFEDGNVNEWNATGDHTNVSSHAFEGNYSFYYNTSASTNPTRDLTEFGQVYPYYITFAFNYSQADTLGVFMTSGSVADYLNSCWNTMQHAANTFKQYDGASETTLATFSDSSEWHTMKRQYNSLDEVAYTIDNNYIATKGLRGSPTGHNVVGKYHSDGGWHQYDSIRISQTNHSIYQNVGSETLTSAGTKVPVATDIVVNLTAPTNNNLTSNDNFTFTFNITSMNTLTNCSLRLDGSIQKNYTLFGGNCSQETANVSTSCGGLSTGYYDWVGSWVTPSNTADGDWATSGYAASSSFFKINYTKPIGASRLGTKWVVKDASGTRNLTIPEGCWNKNNDVLELLVLSSSGGAGGVHWKCANSTDIDMQINNTEKSSRLIYEENITWAIDGRTNFSLSYNISTIAEGHHNWSAECTDDTGNLTSSDTYYFQIDQTPPNITLTSPANNSITNNATFVFYYNVTDNNETQNCSLYIDGNNNKTATTVNGTIQFSGFADGNYSWAIGCYDKAGNSNITRNWTIRVDTTKPTISYLIANNTLPSMLVNVSFDITATDTDGFIYSIQNNITYENGTNIFSFNYTDGGENAIAVNTNYSYKFYEVNNFTWAREICDGFGGGKLNCINEKSYFNTTKLGIGLTILTYLSNASISDINLSIGGDTYFSSNGTFSLNFSTGNYTFTARSDTHPDYTDSVEVFANYTEYTFYIFPNRSIFFNFKDEINKDRIENISIELISSNISYNYTTTNGTIYKVGLQNADYTIRYESKDYNERLYEFTIGSNYTNLTLYLLNQSEATNVTAIVYDETGSGVENMLVKMLKYDIDNNSYQIVEMTRTNQEGKGVFQVELFEEFYKFVLLYNDDLKLISEPAYIFETSIDFRVSLGSSVGERFDNVIDIISDLSFNNATKTWRFTYTDLNNVIHQGCLKVYTLDGGGETEYNTSCVSSTTATILLTVPETNGTTYVAKGFIYFDDEYMIASDSWTFFGGTLPTFSGGANLGLLLVAIVTIAFAFIGLWNPTIMIIMVPIPLFLGSIIGLIQIPVYATATIQVIAVILSFILSRRS